MSKYLVFIDVNDLSILDDALAPYIDNGQINEYFTLTENGEPIMFDKSMVGDPNYCNGMAIRCARITEE